MGRTRYLATLCLLMATASPATAQVLIQELLYDGTGTDGDDVFTELVPPPASVWTDGSWLASTATPVPPTGPSIFRAPVIPADGVLVVAATAAAGPVLAARDLIASVDWQNGPDAVQLQNASGDTVDALRYGEAGPFNAGEGLPAPTAAPGQSLSRDSAGVDTDDNFADFILLASPTPGSVGDSLT